jgi:hypothetical protein
VSAFTGFTVNDSLAVLKNVATFRPGSGQEFANGAGSMHRAKRGAIQRFGIAIEAPREKPRHKIVYFPCLGNANSRLFIS